MKVGDKVYIWKANSDGLYLKEYKLEGHNAWGFKGVSKLHSTYIDPSDKNLFTSPEEAKKYLTILQ